MRCLLPLFFWHRLIFMTSLYFIVACLWHYSSLPIRLLSYHGTSLNNRYGNEYLVSETQLILIVLLLTYMDYLSCALLHLLWSFCYKNFGRIYTHALTNQHSSYLSISYAFEFNLRRVGTTTKYNFVIQRQQFVLFMTVLLKTWYGYCLMLIVLSMASLDIIMAVIDSHISKGIDSPTLRWSIILWSS